MASKIIGYVKHKFTNDVQPYVNKDENGYELANGTWWYLCNVVDESKESFGYPENDFEMLISNICDDIKELLIKKNRDYGNSFRKIYDEFGDISIIIRMTDKLERLKSLQSKENEVKDESKEDTLRDLAGYGILALATKQMG